MRGNYRYEEERNRPRGMTPRGFGERGRERWGEWDEDELQQERGRFAGGPDYDRDWGGRGRSDYDDEYGRFRGIRSLGRGQGGGFDEYDEDDATGFRGNWRREGRYMSNRGGRDWGEGNRMSGDSSRFGEGGRFEGGRSAEGGRGWGEGRRDWGSMEPDEMRWGRQQGLYGSSEYGGYLSSQRAQSDFQSHVGKGPKGWQRSDERIREELNEALARHPEIDASDVEVRVQGGEITLTGTVPNRRAKRLVEDVAERVFGAKDVQNNVRVKAESQERFGERDVTRAPDREGRFATEGETGPRKTGTTQTGSSTTR